MKKIHVNIGYTYCKQWSLKEYFKRFFYPTLKRYYVKLLSWSI
jgi:hypothetical protein